MKTCPACRQALPDDALFCPIDGASLASAESDPLLGTVIADRYALLERVGEGNSGTIYRGEHVTLRQRIAVKLLHPRLSEDTTAVERFRQEAAGLAQLQNRHIVRVSDFGVAGDGRVFFAMEFLEGEPLSALLGREGRFGEARALSVLTQVGEALAEAHGLGFMHRDIRPRNIFVTRTGDKDQVKLLDFGLAKLAALPKGGATTLGSGLGDPRYLSPEQARGDQVDQRSDIYALALIAYEMVSGAPPFVGGGTLDVLTKHLEAQPVPLEQRVPGVSRRFAGAVARALAKKTKDRYSSVSRFLEALAGKTPVDEVVLEIPGPTVPEIPGPKVTPTVAAPSAASASNAAPAPQPARPAAARASSLDVIKAAAGPKPGARSEVKVAPGKETPAGTLIGTGLQATDVMRALSSGAGAKEAESIESAVTHPFQRSAPEEISSPTAVRTPTGAKGESLPSLTATAPSAGGPVVLVAPGAALTSDASRTVLETSPKPTTLPKPVIAPTGAVAPPVAKATTSPPPGVTATNASVSAPSGTRKPAPQARPGVRSAPSPGRTPTSPEFSVPALHSDTSDPTSQTGNWFAEGLAAEKELAGKPTGSGPLPAIYDAMDESVSLRRGPSPSLIIGAVVVMTAVALFLAFGLKRKKEPPKEGSSPSTAQVEPDDPGAVKVVPKTAPEPKKIEVQPEPKKIEVQPAPKKLAAAARHEPTKKVAVVKPEPKPKAAVKPEPKPKAAVKPEPTKKAAVVKREPKPKAAVKHEPTKKVAVVKPEPVAKAGRDPGAADAQIKAGRNALQRGEYGKAKEAFTKALELGPGSPAAHAGLGEVAFEQGQYGPAATHFKAAVRGSPRNARFQVMLGNAYFKSAKTKQAVEQYRKALAMDPGSAEAKAGLQAAVRRLGGL